MHQILSRNLDNNDREEGAASKKELISNQFGFLTRSLVKNNIVKQNLYVTLLALEYLSMMYYIIRLADTSSFNKVFKPIERFLDVTATENGKHVGTSELIIVNSSGTNHTESILVSPTDYVQNKARMHCIINLAIMGIYSFFTLILVMRIVKIKSFDQTQSQSYTMKSLAGFLVATSTVFQMPVFISIFITIKLLT